MKNIKNILLALTIFLIIGMGALIINDHDNHMNTPNNEKIVTHDDPVMGEYKVEYLSKNNELTKIETKSGVGSTFTLTLSQFAHTSSNDVFNAYYDDSGIYAGFYYDYLKTLYLFKIGWDGKINWSTGMKLDVQPYQIVVLSNNTLSNVSYIILLKNGSVIDIILDKTNGNNINSFMILDYSTSGNIHASTNYDDGIVYIGKLIIDANGNAQILNMNDTSLQYIIPTDYGYIGLANINGEYGGKDVKVDVVKNSGETFSYWFGTTLDDEIFEFTTPIHSNGRTFIVLNNPDNTNQLTIQEIGTDGHSSKTYFTSGALNYEHARYYPISVYVIKNKFVIVRENHEYYTRVGFFVLDLSSNNVNTGERDLPTSTNYKYVNHYVFYDPTVGTYVFMRRNMIVVKS